MQTFAFTASPTNGYTLTWESILFNYGAASFGACYMSYAPGSNTIGLFDNMGAYWVDSGSLGDARSITNGYCSINLQTSNRSGSPDTTLTLNLAITFLGTMPGNQGIYMAAGDSSGLMVGWLEIGAWTTIAPLYNQGTTVTSSTASGQGLMQTFTHVATNPNGANYIMAIDTLINTSLTYVSGCAVAYFKEGNVLSLLNDQGVAAEWVTVGAAVTKYNSQCTLDVEHSRATPSGNTLTLELPITFNQSWAGAKNVWGIASDRTRVFIDWQLEGTWTVAPVSQPPTVLPVTPSGQTGMAQTFTFTASSVNGYQYLTWISILFNDGATSSGACYMSYFPASHQITIYDNAGIPFSSGTLGTPKWIANGGYCSVNLQYPASGSLDKLILTLPITFTAAMPGHQGVYMAAGDAGGLMVGWQEIGTWTTIPPLYEQRTTVSTTTQSGQGLSQRFTYVASNPNGANYITSIDTLINNSLTYLSGCAVAYFKEWNALSLLNDQGVAAEWVTPGTAVTKSNSQCTLDVQQSRATPSGNTLTLELVITFNPSWAGTKKFWGIAFDRTRQPTDWQLLGTWTVGTVTTWKDYIYFGNRVIATEKQ